MTASAVAPEVEPAPEMSVDVDAEVCCNFVGFDKKVN